MYNRENISKRGTFNVFGFKLQSVGKVEKEVGIRRREADEIDRGNMTSF